MESENSGCPLLCGYCGEDVHDGTMKNEEARRRGMRGGESSCG